MIGESPRWIARTFAVLVLLTVLAVLASLAVAPFMVSDAWREDQERNEARLALLERRAAQRDRLVAEQKSRAAAGTRSNALLEGATFGLASAELQKLLVEGVQSAGLTLRSIQALEPVGTDDFTTLPVRMVVKGTTEGLRALLHGLETGEPLLFIDELSVKPERSTLADEAPAGPIELAVELRVSGTVAGRKAP
jgi:general secretion pathway protein M